MHNLSMMTFPSAPHPIMSAPATRLLRVSESYPTSSNRKTQLPDFLKSPKILRACFQCMLDLTDCISHSTNTLGKGMNPNILPPAMSK